MDVIGHRNEFILVEVDLGTEFVGVNPLLKGNYSCQTGDQHSLSNFPENISLPVRAYRHEIRTGLGVIIPGQAR
jgi:hypothetical protein